MRDVRVRDRERLDEIVHGDDTEPVFRERLELPAEDGHPPLAVERTIPVAGPFRPPVILVHGFAQNRYSWRLSRRSMVAWLARQGHEVLVLELRGHGESRALGAGNATEFHEYVVDLLRVIRRVEVPPFVIGHSLGGAVAIGASTEVPLAGLVHLAGVYTFATDNRTLRGLAHLTKAFEPLLTLAPVRMKTGWAGDLIARLYSVTDIAGYGAPIAGWVPDSFERDLLEERLTKGFDWTSVEVWLQMSRWATGEPLAYAPRFAEIDLPLLVIVGDADPLVRPADARRCYEGSGSTDKELLLMEAFEHQVHWGHIDLILGRKAPEEVWPRIGAWLAARS